MFLKHAVNKKNIYYMMHTISSLVILIACHNLRPITACSPHHGIRLVNGLQCGLGTHVGFGPYIMYCQSQTHLETPK